MSGQRDICRDYVAGRCKEEGECKFAHPEHDPRKLFNRTVRLYVNFSHSFHPSQTRILSPRTQPVSIPLLQTIPSMSLSKLAISSTLSVPPSPLTTSRVPHLPQQPPTLVSQALPASLLPSLLNCNVVTSGAGSPLYVKNSNSASTLPSPIANTPPTAFTMAGPYSSFPLLVLKKSSL